MIARLITTTTSHLRKVRINPSLYRIPTHPMAQKANTKYESKPKQTEFVDDEGNKISKNAWKKLQKAKAAKAKKASKPKQTNQKINESNLSPNQYFELRSQMVASEEQKGNKLYPHKFEVTSSIPQFLKT